MFSRQEELLTRSGSAVLALARDLLVYRPGDRIPRIADYAAQFHRGVGTVQVALRHLEDIGAIKVESRGHKGSYLMVINYPLLWEASSLGSLVCTMPLPYSRRYEGLATGLVASALATGLPFTLSFMRGASQRLRALKDGKADLAVVSGYAAQLAQPEGYEVVAAMGPRTYVERHALLVADPSITGIRPGLRLGVDRSSPDQWALTQAEVGDVPVTLVDLGYMQVAEALLKGEVDAAVWNVDELTVRHPGLGVVPLASPRGREISVQTSEAALLAYGGRPEIRKIVEAALPVKKIRQIQVDVLDGRRQPAY